MLMSSGTLISDCHNAPIYLEGGDYYCTGCCKPCKSAGTFADKYQRDNAITNEHNRLRVAVVDKAKARRAAEKVFDKTPATAQALLAAEIAEDGAVDVLIEFEKEHKIGE